MFEIEIPEIFIVSECCDCGYLHAAIRDCPTPMLENDSCDPSMQRWE